MHYFPYVKAYEYFFDDFFDFFSLFLK